MTLSRNRERRRKRTIAWMIVLALFICLPLLVQAADDDDEEEILEFDKPALAVPIPTIKFTNITVTDEGEDDLKTIDVPWLAEYLNGVYQYAIGMATIIAAVMMMVGGFQYLTAGGDATRVAKGKEKIKNAILGLFLTLSAYLILRTVNPEMTVLGALTIQVVERIEIEFEMSSEDGFPSGGIPEKCAEAIRKAKEEHKCTLEGGIVAPVTGKQVSCNYHFKDADYDYTKIKAIDTGGSWGDALKSPVNGKAYVWDGAKTAHKNVGGNCVVIVTASGNVSLCHLKDFVKADGTPLQSGEQVSAGDQIGHVGGRCCQGQEPPSRYKAAERGWCRFPGTPCTDNQKVETCDCQTWQDGGNTSGPHVHITFNDKENYLLSCLVFQ